MERAFREHFDAVFEAAYVSATGRSRGSAYYKDAFREIVLSDQGHAEAWGAVQGPLVMLGEADRAEFADLPPVARLYAEMSLAGDTYEAALATVLGETEARRLHTLENGWGFSGVSLGDASAPPHCHEADYPEGY